MLSGASLAISYDSRFLVLAYGVSIMGAIAAGKYSRITILVVLE